MAFFFGLLMMDVVAAIFAIIAGIYVYFRYFLYNYWRELGVVYVEPTIPSGNIGSVIAGKIAIGEVFANAYEEHKRVPYFGMYTFHKPSLVIVEPNLIRHILTKEFTTFHDRGIYLNETIDPLSGHLFALPGAKWRNLRAKLSPTFTSGKMRLMMATVVECGEKLTQHLKGKAEKREVVEVKDLFARFGTDVIMSTAFGVNCNSLDNPNSEFRYWGQKAFEPKPFWNLVSMFAPTFMRIFSIPVTDRGVTKFFTKIFKETLDYRESNNVVRPDFMNMLNQLINRGYVDGENDGDTAKVAGTHDGKITLMEGAAQAFVFFLAGFETTSAAITFCLYELACNQDIQDKVMKDIDTAIEKFNGVTYESVQEMTYLHKVVSETLRKYPPLPILNRVCTKNTQLPGTNLRLSEGLDIIVPILGLHRDPDIYPNPDEFDPERFNEENIAARHPYAYLPFGEGPRICIGMRFGYTQTKVGLISMLSKYRVRLGPETPVPLKMDPGGVILTVQGGIELLVEER